MPDKSEKLRRKEVLRELAAKQRAEWERQLPMSLAQLHGLLAALDIALATGCNHTLQHTEAYLHSQDLAIEEVVPWLQEHGGFCDCEVLANVEEEWGEL
ncbi:MAG: DUF2695 domain-containing protein [bacterium]|jgi:hypothetical protein